MSGMAILVGPGADEASVRKMLTAAPHRGHVTAVHVGKGVSAGAQGREEEDPFVSASLHRAGDRLAVWCGCLYDGASIVTGPEAGKRILDAYDRGGARAVGRLSGSYAAAVVDERRSSALAIRSAVGERPLFWRQHANMLFLASEVKQVVAGPAPRPELDLDALWDLVALTADDMEATSLREVKRVMAGCWVDWRSSPPTKHRFWRPDQEVGTARTSLPDALEGFRHHLRVAVDRRLSPGTGLLLSGGLDSNAVAWAAAPLHVRRYGTPLRVVTAAYPDHPEVDETQYVKQTVSALDLDQPVWVHPEPHPFRGLDEAAWLHDGPEIAPLASNLRHILSGAKQAGIATVLDGHDGDTVLGASPQGVPQALLRRARLGTFGRFVGFRRQRLMLSRRQALRHLALPPLIDLFPWIRRLKGRSQPPRDGVPGWVGADLRARIRDKPVGGSRWSDTRGRTVLADLPRAMEYLERQALVEGVTILHPLCDPDLLRFLMRMPPEILFARGAPKSLVRLGCLGLPCEVLGRTDKTAFDVVAVRGSPAHEILRALEGQPGIAAALDALALEEAIKTNALGFGEVALLHRILSAGRLLDPALKPWQAG